MIYKTREEFDSEENYVRYLHQQEIEYGKNLEDNVENGIFHPMFSYFYEKSKSLEEKITTKEKFKNRYNTCKECEHFVNITKQCKKCFCFMPIKTQFEIFKCPEGKW
jgi:hypothetical protein